jgi:hypothetical protein
MGRFFLLLLAAVGGYVLFSQQAWDYILPQDQLIWAALLPGAYLLGLALLRD